MIYPTMKNRTKEVGNINMSGRLKQVFVLILAILIGMIISVTTADAKDYQRENQKRNKVTYRKHNQTMAKACSILSAKRNNTANTAVKDRVKLKYR